MVYRFQRWQEVFTPPEGSPELSLWQRAVLWHNGGLPDFVDAAQEEPELYARHVEICKRQGIAPTRLLIIDYHEKTAGAFPEAGVTYVSRPLLEVPSEQVDFTLAHEASHHAHATRDFLANTAITVAAVAGFAASAVAVARGARGRIENQALADAGAAVAAVGLAKVWQEAHGIGKAYYARQFMELPADRDAVLNTRDPEAAIAQLEMLKEQRDRRKERQEAAGIKIQPDDSWKRAHPMHDDRVRQIRTMQVQLEPQKAR